MKKRTWVTVPADVTVNTWPSSYGTSVLMVGSHTHGGHGGRHTARTQDETADGEHEVTTVLERVRGLRQGMDPSEFKTQYQ